MRQVRRKFFGTDGVRGKVGSLPITPDYVMRLGYAAGRVLARVDDHLPSGEMPTVLIGKDTRISGYMLESALQAGLTASGVHVLLTGPLPTPAIAYLTRAWRAQAGIVISASHNLYQDNGIKFFSSSGLKLADDLELQIETVLEQGSLDVVPSAQLGRVRRIDDAAGRYVEFCKSTFPNTLDLRGLRIVIDCAHGATYHVAPDVFHELGAEVIAIHNHPNGLNINEQCGSTSPGLLAQAVLKHQADLGIALDGDGDRVVMIDRYGKVLDGDQLLYVIAMHRHKSGTLKGGVVGTQMSNAGLEAALREQGIPFFRSRVGDRYVLQQMNVHNCLLGGENSGHILCLDKHTSGDGIIASLQVLQAMLDQGVALHDMLAGLVMYDQVLLNVELTQPLSLQSNPAIDLAVQQVESILSGRGRVLLRKSGTEPKIRVMVEAVEHDVAQMHAQQIADAIQRLML